MIDKGYNIDDYAIALQRAIEHHCRERKIPKSVEDLCPYHTDMLNNFSTKIIKEDTMKDRMEIDGIWYKREDTLLKTDETLRIIGVEPFYRESGEYLRLMFDMPSAKFNVGDELAIYNLTKLRKLRK